VRDRVPPPLDAAAAVEETSEQQASTSQPDTNHTVRTRADNNLAPPAETETETAPTNEVVVPTVPTVTVAIDPATGLLATPACPVKTRMTYPSGSEPKGHCNLTHITKPEKETGLKGLAKRIVN
jgi:hypothetical protein